MLLKQQYIPEVVNKESEAFAATVIVFKIKLKELAMAAGINISTVERFKSGHNDLSTGELYKVISAMTPAERGFYNSMRNVQLAAEDAKVNLPLLDFSERSSGSDVYRDAFAITSQVFGVQQKFICSKTGIQSSNINAWVKGTRDIQVSGLVKIKSALSPEQRTFMDAISDVLISLSTIPAKRIQQLEADLAI